MVHIKKKGTGKTAEASSETPKPLKPKRKISKSAQDDGIVDFNKLKGVLQDQEEKSKKKKNNLERLKVSSSAEKEDAKTFKVRGMKQKNAVNGERSEKRKDTIRIREKHALLQNKQHNENFKEKFNRSKKNEENQIHNERQNQNRNRKEKLGGMIFMCNERTKQDCFRYRVMGVQMGKKEMVLGLKPGLKLFLYDTDLRVMYGIYKASSSGGINLESAAFDGDYPVQVRFGVDQDCYPLPESVFKRAIKENYTGIHRFKPELSVQQVKKLTGLFRPAELPSHAQSIIHPQPVMVTIQGREVNGGAREPRGPLHMESLARDPPTYGEGRRYQLLSNEYEHQHLTYKEVPPSGRDVSLDYYPSEKEYRAYGLLRTERQNFSKSAPALDPYSRSYVREQLPPTVTTQDREISEGAREFRAQLHSEPLAVDPRSYVGNQRYPVLSNVSEPLAVDPRSYVESRTYPVLSNVSEPLAVDPCSYAESRRYPVLSNVSDQHLTYRDVLPRERENFSHGNYPSEKEYRTYGLRREIQNFSPPRSHITPTSEPYSRDHVREHLVMHASYDPHVVTEKAFETYNLVPRRELQSSTPLVTPTISSTLDTYDPYYGYNKGGSVMDPHQLPLRREEVPLGSYSFSGRGEAPRSVPDHLQARDSYLTQTEQSRKGESYLTENNHLGRMKFEDVRMLHPTYASSALSYYDRVQKYPEARTETSHASLYSLAGPSLSNRLI